MPRTKKNQQSSKQRKPSGAAFAKRGRPATLATNNPVRTRGGGFSRQRGTDIRVSHSEFFSTLDCTTLSPFARVWGWTIQPNSSSLFPWLSRLTDTFDKYKFHSLAFEFVPRVPATFAGSVVIAASPDAAEPDPTEDELGRVRLLAKEGALSASVWSSQRMTIPTHWLQQIGERFIYHSSDASGDIRLTSAGVIWFATYGCSTATVDGTIVGDLIVHYDVSLMIANLDFGLSTDGTVSTTSIAFPGVTGDPIPESPPGVCSTVTSTFEGYLNKPLNPEGLMAMVNATKHLVLNAEEAYQGILQVSRVLKMAGPGRSKREGERSTSVHDFAHSVKLPNSDVWGGADMCLEIYPAVSAAAVTTAVPCAFISGTTTYQLLAVEPGDVVQIWSGCVDIKAGEWISHAPKDASSEGWDSYADFDTYGAQYWFPGLNTAPLTMIRNCRISDSCRPASASRRDWPRLGAAPPPILSGLRPAKDVSVSERARCAPSTPSRR